MPILWTALLAGVVILGHRLVPNVVGNLGSLVEAFLPWSALVVPILLGLALLRRSLTGLAAALVPLVAWVIGFSGYLLPRDAGAADLIVVQHNVSDENPDPAGTARAMLTAHPDLIGMEEVVSSAYDEVLGAELPFHAAAGTVALWSRYPVISSAGVDIRPHDLGADWNRGLRAVVRAPGGDIAVYVVHLPSMRIGVRGLASERRDESARKLGALLAAEPTPRLLVIGDLNTSVDDRGLAPIRRVTTPLPADFAFTWPASTPVARIDQVLARSMSVTRLTALPRTGSDHLPLAAGIRF